MTRENPAARARWTHWEALRVGPGSKMEGSALPVPHSESLKVLGPKWRKRAISPSCHWSWGAEGRGGMGSGGGLIGGVEKKEEEEGFSAVDLGSERSEMGSWSGRIGRVEKEEAEDSSVGAALKSEMGRLGSGVGLNEGVEKVEEEEEEDFSVLAAADLETEMGRMGRWGC